MSTIQKRKGMLTHTRVLEKSKTQKRTMRKELAEHEGMIRLGMVCSKSDVFIHIERHDVFEPAFNPEFFYELNSLSFLVHSR